MPIERVRAGEKSSKAKRTTYEVIRDWKRATLKIDRDAYADGDEFADLSLQAYKSNKELHKRGICTELAPFPSNTYMVRFDGSGESTAGSRDDDALADIFAINAKATTRSHIHIATTEGVLYCPTTERREDGDDAKAWLQKDVDVARRFDLGICTECKEQAEDAGILKTVKQVLNL